MPDQVENRVLDLQREIALEAATFVAEALAPEAEPEAEVGWLGENPFSHVGDVDALARLVLVVRALEGPEGSEEVDTAIEGAGRKNLVLGGAEIVALAGLGVIALRILVTKGKLTEETITMKPNPETGVWSVIIKRVEKPISISDDLAAVLRSFFPGG